MIRAISGQKIIALLFFASFRVFRGNILMRPANSANHIAPEIFIRAD
jgi:hypothetical protein